MAGDGSQPDGVLGSLAILAGGRADGELPGQFAAFLDHVAPQWRPLLADHPWYDRPQSVALPVEADSQELRTRANGLRVAAERAGVAFLGAGLEIVPEGRFNGLCETIGNKSRLLFSCAARLIQRLFDRFGSDRLTIVCDKQGGRNSYLRILQQHWPGLHVTVLDESADFSAYILAGPAATPSGVRAMEIRFVPKADSAHLPAALASMYCKYTREVFMRLFNAFWQSRVDGELATTAGYYTDGRRFARQIDATARRLGIDPRQYLRQR